MEPQLLSVTGRTILAIEGRVVDAFTCRVNLTRAHCCVGTIVAPAGRHGHGKDKRNDHRTGSKPHPRSSSSLSPHRSPKAATGPEAIAINPRRPEPVRTEHADRPDVGATATEVRPVPNDLLPPAERNPRDASMTVGCISGGRMYQQTAVQKSDGCRGPPTSLVRQTEGSGGSAGGVMSQDADGKVDVLPVGDGDTALGAVIGGNIGLVVGLFAPTAREHGDRSGYRRTPQAPDEEARGDKSSTARFGS